MDDKHSEVFRQYDLKVYNMYRARGAFLLETNQGLKLFKSFEDSENHLLYENKVKEVLVNKGFANVDMVLPNRDGGLITADSAGVKYIIKNWFEGEECNLKELKDIYAASKNLARVHDALEGVGGEAAIFQSHLEEVFMLPLRTWLEFIVPWKGCMERTRRPTFVSLLLQSCLTNTIKN